MMKIVKWCIVALVTVTLTTEGRSGPVLTVFGYGNQSCGSWTQERAAQSIVSEIMAGWVGAFVTGFEDGVNFEVGHGADGNGLAGWIDNYCRLHPLKDIFHASEALVTALRGLPPLD